MRILYFASVRQRLGKPEETIAIPAGVTTLRELAASLANRDAGYASVFGDLGPLCAAINQVHARFDAPIAGDDEVAFFPPVTGG